MKKIFISINRHRKKFILAIFFGYCTIWAVVEPLMSILELKTRDFSWYWFSLYIIASIFIGFVSAIPKKSVNFSFTNTNTKVIIEFGDLFNSEGHKVIPANEYFDSLIGRPVSTKSVHGIFIEKTLGGHNYIIDDAVAAQLHGQEIEIVNRPEGKQKKFSIGTTITIKHTESIYFLFALCNSDYNCKVTCNPSLMLKALEGLWEKVRIEGNGFPVNLPLVGNGRSGVGLPPSQLLQLILMSLLRFTKEKELNTTIKIILTEDIFNEVDLELIKNNWQ